MLCNATSHCKVIIQVSRGREASSGPDVAGGDLREGRAVHGPGTEKAKVGKEQDLSMKARGPFLGRMPSEVSLEAGVRAGTLLDFGIMGKHPVSSLLRGLPDGNNLQIQLKTQDLARASMRPSPQTP